jgi:DNA-binding NtrC family response regulator
MATILAIDSDRSVRQAYRLILTGRHQCLLADTPDSALRLLASESVDAVLLDVTLPGGGGMALLDQFTSNARRAPVIAVSGLKALGEAVDALKHGARDCLIKPFDVHHLTLVIDRVLEHDRMARELDRLRAAHTVRLADLAGSGPAMAAVFDQVRRAADTTDPVLLVGEPGTGRATLARALHCEGPCADRPFETFVGGNDWPEALRRTQGGTLHIPEIAALPEKAFEALLDTAPDAPRPVFATRHDPRAAVADGRMPESFLTRLQSRRISLPPLRERPEDIGALAALFLERHRRRTGSPARHFSAPALDLLHDHPWPGNLREMDHAIGCAVETHDSGEVLDAPAIAGVLSPASPASDTPRFEDAPLDEATALLERWMIGRALDEADGNQSRAAEILGTTRRVLKYKMDNLGIAP